jgi:O-antigen/teichoic acid export membrane protein
MNLVGSVINGLLTFLVVAALASRTSAAEVGAFMVGVGGLTIAAQTSQLSANVGLVRFVSRLRVLDGARAIRPLFRHALIPVLAFSACAGWVLYAVAPVVADVLGADDADRAVRYLQLMAPFVPAMSVFLVLAQGTQGFGTMVPSVLIDRIGRSVLQFFGVLILATSDPVRIAASWVFPYIIGVVFLAAWTRRLIGRLEGNVPVPEEAPPTREFWKFCLPRGLASTFQISMLWLDTILIAFLRSPEEAGIYSVASRFLVIGTLVVASLLQATNPRLAEYFALDDHPRASALYRRTAGWLVTMVWPAYIMIFAFAPWLLSLFGPEYESGVTALRIVSGALMLSAACGSVDMVLLMGGRSSLSVVNWGLALIVYLILNFLLIPDYGIEGAAVAWAASIVVRNVIPLFEVWVLMRLNPFSRAYFHAAAVAVVSVGGASALSVAQFGHTIQGVVVALLVGGGLYLLMLSPVVRTILHGPEVADEDGESHAPDYRPRTRGLI